MHAFIICLSHLSEYYILSFDCWSAGPSLALEGAPEVDPAPFSPTTDGASPLPLPFLLLDTALLIDTGLPAPLALCILFTQL